MSKSTWDSLSQSQRDSLVDAGRFHADGRTNAGPSVCPRCGRGGAGSYVRLPSGDYVHIQCTTPEDFPRPVPRHPDGPSNLPADVDPSTIPGERPIDAWWGEAVEAMLDHVSASHTIQAHSGAAFLRGDGANEYAARLVAYIEEQIAEQIRRGLK